MAICRAEVADLDPAAVGLYLDDVCVARGGLMADGYTLRSCNRSPRGGTPSLTDCSSCMPHGTANGG